jgi:2-polyprenyl-6-methoxyphenol hydroxylase-like FAD-dependent oxidoreductase
VVRNKISYSSCTIRRKPGHLRGAHAWVMTPVPPLTHFGAAQAWEDDRYIVSFTTYLGESGPASYAEMIEHAQALAFPGLGELLRDAEPLTETVQTHAPESTRRRYERLTRFPSGLLAVGDALCSFNPAYGQGMSVAALEAEALASCLQGGAKGLPTRFFAAAAKIVDAPWMLATGADFQWPAVEGRRPLGTALINAYVARVIAAAGQDTLVAERLLRVLHLLSAPSSLFSPAILRRVLLAKRKLSLAPGAQVARVAQVAADQV